MKRSKVTTLPPEVKAWLDAALIQGNFTGYEQLAGELAKRGCALSKSAVHRYGAQLEQRMSAIKASTEAARLIAQESPDDADHRSAAVISMIQTEVFNVLVQLQESTSAEDATERAALLGKVAKNVATLTRASVAQKRHELDVRDKVAAAAKAAAGIAKAGGLSAKSIEEIRRSILGIAK